MSDTADDIAAQLDSALAEAKERQRVERRLAEADEQERELRFYEAGVPMHEPVAELFLSAYDGPLDADAITAAWFEKVLDQPVPRDVAHRIETKRIADELRTKKEK